MIKHVMNIDLVPGEEPNPRVYLNQYDRLEDALVFRIWHNNQRFTIPSGCKAKIQATKVDRTGFSYDCKIQDNEIIANVEDQMTVFDGVYPCEIRIYKDYYNEIGTINFYMDIEKSPLLDDTKISETDLPAIIAEAQKQMEAAAASATEAESFAHGGTGTREGEDTDNAKYWYELATEFKDEVEASKNAAKQSEINAAESEQKSEDWSNISKSWAVGDTGEREGEDTNNSKYWSDLSKDYKVLSESWAVGGTNTRDGEDSNNSKFWALQSLDHEDKAKEYAKICEQYSDVLIPEFELNFDDMNLYQTNYYEESVLVFNLTDDKYLEYEFVP